MALIDNKITNADYTAKDISSLSDRPSRDGMSASQLKERFDTIAKTIVAPKFNDLIDDLVVELADKVDKEVGKGLSSNDFTDVLKSKLDGIEEGAEVNTVTSVASRVGDVVLTKSDVGLSNADNTSDLDKPISTATQSALDGKAPLVHGHSISDVAHLQTVLDDKAKSGHNHVKADINDFAHVHPISEVTGLQTALNGKANTTTTINNQPLSSNITINASDVPNTPAGNISATNVQNAINELDTEKVNRLMATNLVTNGDFSNGTTDWVIVQANAVVDSGTLVLTTTGNLARLDKTIPNVQANDRIYVRVSKLTPVEQGTAFRTVSILSPNEAAWFVPNSDGLWVTQSIIRNQTTTGNFIFRLYMYDAIGSVHRFRHFMAINLTQLFGAGNEPTKEQMDKLLSVYPNSWFNGTSEIGSIGALMRASLGVQVVTPTLLNSRTGTAQYVVSNDGLVIFRGTASGGSLNTNIFVLPENIRPAATRTFPISANNAFGVITVAANGEVRQTVGALTNVFLDGIVFKVGV